MNDNEEVLYAYERWHLKLRFTLNDVEWCVLRNTVNGSEILARAENVTPAPKPFLPDGQDRYCNVYSDGNVGSTHPTLAGAESVVCALKRGIIRIDGQTGELSWVEGGPQA